MHRKYSFSYYGGDGYVVKNICEIFPNNGVVVLSLTLHVEPIVLGDPPGFVVAPDHRYPILIFDFEETQQGDDLHTMRAPVHIVPQEQVTRVWQVPTHFEYLQQIIELPVDVSHDCDGC